MTEHLDTEIRREQIVEAALELAGRDGVRRLSVAAIAREVGFVPSAIYRHFRGKQQILDEMLDLIGSRLLARVQDAKERAADPLERLRLLVEAHARLVEQHRGIPRLVFDDELYADRPARRGRILAMVKGYLRGVGGIAREGQKTGQIRSDLSPDTIALLFLGLVQPAAVLWQMSEGRFGVRRHVRRAWPAFRESIEAG